jgi:soluble lytic murein transglycosylase
MTVGSLIRRLFLALVLLGALAAGLYFGLAHYREHRYDRLIESAATRYGIDPALVSAVVWRESRYQPDSVGKAGEIGLMQVREPAAREWARASYVRDFQESHLYDPGTNILAGSWYLARALRRWAGQDDPAPFALAEYNAGLTHARRWAAMPGAETGAGFRNAITFPSTRAYIDAILARYRKTR